MIYIKLHSTDKGDMIGMCDESLIDKILTEGEIEINIKDYSDFYRGQLVEIDKAVEILKPERVYSANIIGTESVKAAIKAKIILKESVKKVAKIPYANAFKITY
jgi:hypothetical protein